MAKFYISSTYDDLKECREGVVRALRRLGHEAIAMEAYVATDQRPLQKCLADVATCDGYIGIFAWRYGFVPKDDNPEHRSITELELLNAPDGTRLLFLLDESAPWPRAKMGQGEDSDNIESLRQRLCNDHVVSFFENAEHLEVLVTAAVSNWQTSRADKPSVAVHVLSADRRVPHWSEAAAVKFSITNLAANAVKLVCLELRVLKRTPISEVAFKKAGAPVSEFQLEATIGDADHIDLLEGLNTQFILEPGSSDAFNLALRGPEGFLIEYSLHARVDDLATKKESGAKSDTLQIEYPIRSLELLKQRTQKQ